MFFILLKNWDVATFYSTQLPFISAKLNTCMYSLPIKNNTNKNYYFLYNMKIVCSIVGLSHPRSFEWTVNDLSSSNLQSVKGKKQ